MGIGTPGNLCGDGKRQLTSERLVNSHQTIKGEKKGPKGSEPVIRKFLKLRKSLRSPREVCGGTHKKLVQGGT